MLNQTCEVHCAINIYEVNNAAQIYHWHWLIRPGYNGKLNRDIDKLQSMQLVKLLRRLYECHITLTVSIMCRVKRKAEIVSIARS